MREIQTGVFEGNRKLYTLNKIKGNPVYGEPFVNQNGKEFREWNPSRSKLAAAILKGMEGIKIDEKTTVLYLGAASGTTVSHVADICKWVFALEFSVETFSDLLLVAEKRKNIIPLLADATMPEEYFHRVKAVDFLYQDIAQKQQVEIFERNCRLFLKPGGLGFLCVKARSIDVSKHPKKIFGEVKEQLKNSFRVLDNRTMQPFQRDHAAFLVQRR